MALLDIDKTLKSKNPGLAKAIPRFIISYIKKIIHQDEMNDIIATGEDKKGLDFIKHTLDYMNISYEVKGIDNVPKEGKYIFAANHPLGGLDGLIFTFEVGKIFPNVKFPVNDLLLNITPLNNIFLPINKHGKQAREAAKSVDDAYASDAQILYFPAGLCSRKQKGRIMDLEWKKNFITKAIKHKRDIIPVHFSGKNSNFFYNLANVRTTLGIKFNFEMIYLPGEAFKQEDKSLTMTFGKPISYKEIKESGLSAQEWSDRLRALVYQI